jgi:hypothetical protein
MGKAVNMGDVQEPEKVNNTCVNTMCTGTMDRGFTVPLLHLLQANRECDANKLHVKEFRCQFNMQMAIVRHFLIYSILVYAAVLRNPTLLYNLRHL